MELSYSSAAKRLLIFPDIWFDEDYILYAMGVLAQHYPEEVLSYMKEHVIKK